MEENIELYSPEKKHFFWVLSRFFWSLEESQHTYQMILEFYDWNERKVLEMTDDEIKAWVHENIFRRRVLLGLIKGL